MKSIIVFIGENRKKPQLNKIRLKNFSILLLLLILGISPLWAAECGDINSDGVINIIDAYHKIVQYYAGLISDDDPEFEPTAADVNGEGFIAILEGLSCH